MYKSLVWTDGSMKLLKYNPKRLIILIIFFIIVLAFFGDSKTVFSTTYYVAKDGDDNNPGTLFQPWKTISKANKSLKAGDTVYIREGRYNEKIAPGNSGAKGRYITYKNFRNERAVITGGKRRLNLGIDLRDVDYIKIDGIILDGMSAKPYKKMKEWVIIHNSNYNVIQNCKMSYCKGWFGIKIDKECQYNRIINNILHHCGFQEPPRSDDYGDIIGCFGSYNLIEGNDVSYGGHNLFELRYGKYNIVRNNNFHNHWGRNGGLQVDISKEELESGYNLIEKNRIIYATHWHNNVYPNPGMQCCQPHAIIRFNEFYENFGHGLMVYCTTLGEGSFTKIYHNVFYHNGYNDRRKDKEALLLADWSQGLGEFRQVSIKNNIFYSNKKPGIKFEGKKGTNQDHVIMNNLESGDPRFRDKSNFDFHLKPNSPCIEAGIYLTYTTSSGKGTQIPVEDAGYFCDGFGLIEGDIIQLEHQSKTYRIIDLDYRNNIITIDKAASWNKGQGVSLTYNGFAPDIGAYEYVLENNMNMFWKIKGLILK